jgi:hypothetical protein
MGNTIVVAIIVVSAVWVYMDATGHKIGRVKEAGGLFNMSAGAWSVVTMFLWIVGFPAYLIKRSALIERAETTPVEVGGRWVKVVVLCVVGGLWVLGTLSRAA